MSAPAVGRIIGRVEPVQALPEATRPLPRLPDALARMTREAAAIRSEVDADQLESALEQARVLCCDFGRLSPTLTAGMDRSREALVAVQALIDLRAQPGRSRISSAQQGSTSSPRSRASRGRSASRLRADFR